MSDSEPFVVAADHVVTPSGWLAPGWLRIAGGRIAAMGEGELPEPAAYRVRWALPGFIDMHVHGGGGASFTEGGPDDVRRAAAFHRGHGTTRLLASLVTAPLDELERRVAMLADLADEGVIDGIHLEGPFLSEKRKGAHDPTLLRDPEPTVIMRLIEQAGGTIEMITVAPELAGGLASIEAMVAAGAVAAVGHTDADDATVAAALDLGATVVTHLFNAMPSIHHREPGPIPRLLCDDRCMVELIADGFHLHPRVIAMAVSAAGPDRVALVTDAMAAAGMPDGDFDLGTLHVAVRNAQARLVEPDGSPGSIAGSTLTMDEAFALMVGLGYPIPEVATMAATTPARWHGLDRVGELAPGYRADLCVVEDRGRLLHVMQAGTWIGGSEKGNT